jgi:hypothetical protein
MKFITPNALAGPQMLFTDPRMRSPSALGAAFCDQLNIALSELQNVLGIASSNGLSTDPTVAAAQAVYDDRSSFAVYVGFLGNACDTDTAEVSANAERVRALLSSNGIDAPKVRPDYQAPNTGIPWWGVLIIGTVSVVAVAYMTGQAATIAKLFKSSRRSTAGYRRRRR